MTRKSVVSGLLPAALGPYSHAVVAAASCSAPEQRESTPLRVPSVTASGP